LNDLKEKEKWMRKINFKTLLLVLALSLAAFTLAWAGKVGEEFVIPATTIGDQDNPWVSADAAGNFVVVWADEALDGDGDGVIAKIYNSDGSVKVADFVATTTTTGAQQAPRVVVAEDGHFIIVWQSTDGTGLGIFAKIFNADGSVLVDEFLVNTFTTGDQNAPSVDMADNGDFVISWVSKGQDKPTESTKTGVYAQRFLANGSKIGNEFLVNTYTTESQADPTVGIFPDGSFVIAWESKGQVDNNDIYFQLYDKDGAAVGSETLANTRITAKSQANPKLVINQATPGFVLTWDDMSTTGGDPSFTGVVAKIYNANGDSLSSDFVVNTTVENLQNHQSVAMAPDGESFIVTWGSLFQDVPGTSPYGAYAQIFTAEGKKVGPEFLVSTWVYGNQDEPSPVFLSDNEFVVVWETRSQASQNQYSVDPDSSSSVSGQIFTLTQVGILLVTDVPEDQGNKVTVCWKTNFSNEMLYNDEGVGFQVTHFNVWREGAEGALHFIGSVPYLEGVYCIDAATGQNEVETTFKVSAHCADPTVIVFSDGAVGISVDNLAPDAPNFLMANFRDEGIALQWKAPKNETPNFYSVYRSTVSGSYHAEPLAKVATLTFVDKNIDANQNYFYVVTATDEAGNESMRSAEVTNALTGLKDATAVPVAYELAQNYPNPFNPTTHIKFALKAAGHVTLQIFDLNGREVATLIDQEMNAGFHAMEWNAATMASGIYFYQLTTENFAQVKKMTLMK
jgi:hypothetical protein